MKKILLAEDDPEIANLLNLHFDGHIYKLVSCATGDEALQKATSESFDIIILDITLPNVGGMEICKKIRLVNTQTPIIMLTCHAEESDKVLALELGADDYVTKPFGILEFMARIKALLRRSDHNFSNDLQKKR